MPCRISIGLRGRRGRLHPGDQCMTRRIFTLLVGCALVAPMAKAQLTGDRIDLYFGDWHGATPRTIRGSLEERDILTRGRCRKSPQKRRPSPVCELIYLRDSGTRTIRQPHQAAGAAGNLLCRLWPGNGKCRWSKLTCTATLPFLSRRILSSPLRAPDLFRSPCM